MRLKIPSRRQDAAFFARLKRQIEAIPKIESARVTPQTASALLLFAEGDGSAIAAALETLDIVSIVESGRSEAGTASANRGDPAGDPDTQTYAGLASGRTDRRALAFTVFLLLVLRQLLRGGWLAPGVALIWLLFEIWRAHAPEDGGSIAARHQGRAPDR